ncbi:hypothetical protein CVT26_010484 [Gymnopilus dilepis]|uniref:Uncharacterized protein n=1 Tax=Gymnopilus dilepis TaxID=231916 RepID=A0A409Y0E8_9AGAR|nr:hypothetical protein CVT26_010484 [Gymnopilus dilepis]
MFPDILVVQRQSRDLIVYSRLAGSVVRVAWPAKKDVPIVPKGLKNFLDSKGAFWECYCGILSMEARPCRIVASKDSGNVFAFCNGLEGDPKCGFFMNLTTKVKTTQLFSDYGHLPSATKCTETGRRANMSPYILSHKLETPLHEIAPYFEGYLGESTYEHGGIAQLNGGIRFRPDNIRPRTKSAVRYVDAIYRATDIEINALASTTREVRRHSASGTQGPSVGEKVRPAEELVWDVVTARTSPESKTLVERLQNEDGITKSEYEHLLEPCNACQRYFEPRALRKHILSCGSLLRTHIQR